MFIFRLIGLNFLSIYPILSQNQYDNIMVICIVIAYQLTISIYWSHEFMDILINYVIVLITITTTNICYFVFEWGVCVFVPTIMSLILEINDKGGETMFKSGGLTVFLEKESFSRAVSRKGEMCLALQKIRSQSRRRIVWTVIQWIKLYLSIGFIIGFIVSVGAGLAWIRFMLTIG